jgi:hypothetical protein
MAKYSSLSQHLSALTASTVSLTFSEIEGIISDKLPSSAFKHHAWWANESGGTHTWAHLWQAAGWLKDTVDFDRQVVTFRRAENTEIDILESLNPQTKETIYDLLQQIDISRLRRKPEGTCTPTSGSGSSGDKGNCKKNSFNHTGS